MPKGYDTRVVVYEKIHSLTPEMFDKLVLTIAPKDGDKIMDVGAGYGAVTREIIARNPNLDIDYCLLEKSNVQIERAKRELKNCVSLNFFEQKIQFSNFDVLSHQLEYEQFDKIAAKSFIHEIPHAEKLHSLRELHKLLKPKGKLVIWQYCLTDEDGDFFRNLMRMKDEIAGFDELVFVRDFLNEAELLDLLREAGFVHIQREHIFDYNLHTKLRLDTEFNSDIAKLRMWNEALIKQLDSCDNDFVKNVKISFNDDNLHLCFKQAIYSAYK